MWGMYVVGGDVEGCCKKKKVIILRLGIEPRTSAVLRPRHNELDYPSKQHQQIDTPNAQHTQQHIPNNTTTPFFHTTYTLITYIQPLIPIHTGHFILYTQTYHDLTYIVQHTDYLSLLFCTVSLLSSHLPLLVCTQTPTNLYTVIIVIMYIKQSMIS